MDIFGDDIDSLLIADQDNLNENIRNENDIEENDGSDTEEKQNGDPIKVEPKKRAVRNPQVNFIQT